MPGPVTKRFHSARTRYIFNNFKDIIIFIILIFIFTLAGYLWKHYYDYTIFGVHVLDPIYDFLIKWNLLTSYWILKTIFSIHLTYVIDTSRLYFTDVSYLYIYHGCSGLVEMAMFLFITLFFPGKWIAKLWFIPVSLLIIYITSILRIVFLSLVYYYKPGWFLFIHEYLFNVIFFVLFFVLWLAWVKWFYKKKPEISQTDLKPKVD